VQFLQAALDVVFYTQCYPVFKLHPVRYFGTKMHMFSEGMHLKSSKPAAKPRMGLAVDSHLLPTLKSRDAKTRTKIGPDKLQVLCPNLRICGHLPASIINGGGDSLWKWPKFRLSSSRDLDLGSGHTAYHHAPLIDLYLHTKFCWNRINFLWTGRRTFYTHCIRSTRRSRPTASAVQMQLASFHFIADIMLCHWTFAY